MARSGCRISSVIVKSLPAIHNLGAMDVLCTDKTGTLTEARIAMTRHVDITDNDSERVLTLAWLNSHFESGLKSPLDKAILAHRESRPFAVAEDRRGAVRLRTTLGLRAGRARRRSNADH